ncbi:hypothetical protein PVAP13_9NG682514 [Panicum virgatum]|uniref:Uncharacterized protein n=1 Tax=Panicum virgatum TaxID=38727 RepID=A0A8T0N2M2_PANVG|nr:hypothetical protein PVAP13_9NG682514 [Panicum virgatum]
MLGRIEWRCVRTQKLGGSSIRPITTGIAQCGWGTGADGIQTLSCNAPRSWVDRMRDQSLCRPRRTGILVMLNNHAGAGRPLYMHYDASSPEKPTCFHRATLTREQLVTLVPVRSTSSWPGTVHVDRIRSSTGANCLRRLKQGKRPRM